MNIIREALAKLKEAKDKYFAHLDPEQAIKDAYQRLTHAIAEDFAKLHDEFQHVKARLEALEATAVEKLEHKVPPAPAAPPTDAGAGAAPAASAPATDEGSAPVEKQPAPAPAASTEEGGPLAEAGSPERAAQDTQDGQHMEDLAKAQDKADSKGEQS